MDRVSGGGGKAYLEREKKLINFFQNKINKGQTKIDKDLAGFVKESKLDFNNTQFVRVLKRNFPNTFVYKGMQYEDLPQSIKDKIINLSKTKPTSEIARELKSELPAFSDNTTASRSIKNFLVKEKITPVEQLGGSSMPMEERLAKEKIITDYVKKNPEVITANAMAKNINLQNPGLNMSDSFVETSIKRLKLDDLITTRHAEIFPQVQQLDKILKKNKKLLLSDLPSETKKNTILEIYAKETNQNLDDAAENLKSRLSKLGRIYAGEEQRYEKKLYSKIKAPANYMNSYLHQNIVGITNRAGKISNYEMGKLLGLPKKELDLIQGTANMMNAFDFKVAGDHTDIKALMKKNNFRNYKKNFTRIEYIKDNLNEYKRNYDRKILALSKQAEVATPTVQQELLKQQKALQDDFANKTGYRIGGFDIEKGRVTINPQTLRLPDLKNPYNDTLQTAMKNFSTTGLPGKKGTTFNQVDQRLINATPQERIEIFEEIAGTDKAKKSKYLKALQKIPKIGKLATAVIGGTAGAVGISSLATAEEQEQKYKAPEDIEFGDPETWDKKVLDFVKEYPVISGTAAGTTAIGGTLATKTGRKALGTLGKTLISTPIGAAAINLGVGIDPKETLDRTFLEAELAAAPALVKGAEAMTKNPLLQKALTLGISPRMANIMSGAGIAALAGEALYGRGKGMMEEAEKISAMEPGEEQQRAIEEYAAEAYRGYAMGGRVGLKDGSKPPKMDRRMFMKIIGGIMSLPILGKVGKVAKPTVKALAKEAQAIKIPPYFFKLVDKIKNLGEDVTKRLSTQEREVVYNYRTPDADYELIEDLNTGDKRIKILKGDPDFPGYKEEELTLTKGRSDETTGRLPDEYDEYTVRSDFEGKMKDIDEGIEDIGDLVEEVGVENVSLKDLQDAGYDVDRLPYELRKKLGIK
jgi:cell fate (sporulation/competence/biofilm development) regulator YlbF (YheA/YmcA/DUF963 family)